MTATEADELRRHARALEEENARLKARPRDRHGIPLDGEGGGPGTLAGHDARSSASEEETRLRAIFESAVDVAIIAIDRDGLITDWNSGAERILGWTAEEMRGQAAERFFTPEDRAARWVATEMHLALTDGRAAADRWHVRKDGTRFRASGEMMLLRAQEGAHLGFVKVLRDRTAEQATREALRLSEAGLRRAQEAGGVGVFWIDIGNDILRASPEFCRLFGLPVRDEHPAKAIEDLIVPDDAELISNAARRRDGTAAREVEYRVRRADTGEERFIARKGEFEYDASGRPVRFVGVVRDITEQVGARRALEEEREQLAQLFEQAPTFMALLRGSEHRIERVNPGYVALIGGRDVVGKTVAEALPDAVAQGFLDLLDKVYRTGEPFAANGYKYAVQATPGGPVVERYVDFVYQPIRDHAGRVSGIFVEGADVTARTLKDAALRESEERLQQLNETLEARVVEALAERKVLADIVEGTNAFVQVVDPQFCWLAINGAAAREFERIFGVRPKAGDCMLDLLADQPDHQTAVQSVWKRALAGEEFVEIVEIGEFGDPKRDRRHYEMRFSALRDANGQLIGAYQFVYDVTDRLRGQERLRQAEDQLRQSQKMEAVGQLTGGLAHDFNNMLAGIVGSLELTQTRLLQGRYGDLERYIGAAQGAAKRAAALTHRLLAFSRRQTLDPKPTDVNRLVVEMEDLVRRTVGPAVSIEVVAAGGLWPTLVDPSQLESALLNLCINARDAMPEGGRIVIETGNRWLDARAAKERGLEPGQYLSLCVSDNGTGMPPEVVAKAFDPFFTTKPIGEGTGLGLSMIYGFAKQSGGQVRIYSELGRGTMVCLYLPRHYGDAGAGEFEANIATSRANAGETILVVDDEPTIRMLVTEVLEDLGYTVIEAADGAAALNVLQSDVRVDLLVTDIGLPGGLNGRQVAEAARGGRPDLKVLFITGFAENAVLNHGHLAPGMQVLTKPFAMDTLATRVREMIGRYD